MREEIAHVDVGFQSISKLCHGLPKDFLFGSKSSTSNTSVTNGL
jgi:hypothetical protein